MSEAVLPTAGELARLTEACRVDAGSPLFVDLADAYLSLGRPRDAIKVAVRGLKANPEFLEGRIALSRAFVILHQWKEAQVELVKVVKVNRSYREAFVLLGEVLLRRGDFDRAFPVLQHAQNLDPADPRTLVLLKHARARKPLDPPPPPPMPLEPRPTGSAPAVVGTPPPAPPPPSRPLAGIGGASPIDEEVADDEELTEVADEPAGSVPFDPLEPPRVATDPAELASAVAAAAAALPVAPRAPRPVAPAAPEVSRPAPAPAAGALDFGPPVDEDEFDGAEAPDLEAGVGGVPKDTEQAAALSFDTEPAPVIAPPAPAAVDEAITRVAPRPQRTAAAIRDRLPLSPSPTGEETAIPTPVRADKRRDEALAPTERAVLSPALVESAPAPDDEPARPAPRRRAEPATASGRGEARDMDENYLNNLLLGGARPGQEVVAESPVEPRMSVRRSFVVLFVLLFAAVVGGVTWYWHSERRRAAEVARHLDAAKTMMRSTTYVDFERALGETRKALERDRDNVYAVTVFAEIGALSALLYNSDPSEAAMAAGAAAKKVSRGGERGRRELLIARAALSLATLPAADKPVAALTETQASLDAWLDDHPEDLWARWLQGRAALAAGDRRRARSAFEMAGVAEGPVIALVDRADMQVDDGEFEAAQSLYQRALEQAPGHPLALVGRDLSRAERGVDLEPLRDELLAIDSATSGARVDSYRNLALTFVYYGLEDYPAFLRSLGKSIGTSEPRYLARVGLARLLAGQISDAVEVRSRIKWYGTERPEIDPLVAVLDAQLYLAYGLPKSALSAIGTLPGWRASLVRGRALFDEDEYAAAVDQLASALADVPSDRDVAMWSAAARYLASTRKERAAADAELDLLSEKSRVAACVQGLVHLRARVGDARKLLEASLTGDKDVPQPLGYRAQVALAQLDFDAGKLTAARGHLDAALAQNRGFLPIHGLLGRVLLAQRDYPGAVDELSRVVDEQMADPTTELAFAEALVAQAEVSDADRERARQAVRRVAAADPTNSQLARVANLVDPALAKELGLAK